MIEPKRLDDKGRDEDSNWSTVAPFTPDDRQTRLDPVLLDMHVHDRRGDGASGIADRVSPSNRRSPVRAVPALRSRPGSVAERWASLVLQTLDADHDPKTIAAWARWVGVSRSALCEYCRLVHVAAHDARDFARLLRAISRSGERWQPEAVLDFADNRTLNRLLTRGGLSGGDRRVPTVREFLEHQQLVPASNPGLVALRRWLFAAITHAQAVVTGA